jgi:hypothetical protein
MPRGSKTVADRLSDLRELRRISYSTKNSESPLWVFGDDDATERIWECLECRHDYLSTPRDVFVRKMPCPFCKKGSERACPRSANCEWCVARSAASTENAAELARGGVRFLRGPNGETAEEMRVVCRMNETATEGATSAFECLDCGKLFRDLLSRVLKRERKCPGCPKTGDFEPREWSKEDAEKRFAERFEACGGETIEDHAEEFAAQNVRFLRGPDGETESETLVDPLEKKTFDESTFSTLWCRECGKMWRERAYDAATRKTKCKKCAPFVEGYEPREWLNGLPVIRNGKMR